MAGARGESGRTSSIVEREEGSIHLIEKFTRLAPVPSL